MANDNDPNTWAVDSIEPSRFRSNNDILARLEQRARELEPVNRDAADRLRGYAR